MDSITEDSQVHQREEHNGVKEEPSTGNEAITEQSPIPTIKRPKLESREQSIDNFDKSQKQPPMHEIVGGSSVRRYLNQYLTKHLLEGLKEVGQKKPQDPLEYLGKFLIERSQELKKIEGEEE
ncbi:uncharacterized protein J8A68_006164 [[Candida] subhashii]|uniref:COMPASS component SDC1 n=1 Tax=[Candida] subhashii TaxID=561895 RepID=A0A8J5QAU2_9ASCO|nr:uncharacterized protein J8A68_006164 [[Candida] subhashii]KAG7660327.1 hypothetical protein J8A68_006164 [[Candida] subhashii]